MMRQRIEIGADKTFVAPLRKHQLIIISVLFHELPADVVPYYS